MKNDELKETIYKKVLALRMNAKYHQWRVNHFERIDKLISFVITFCGSATFVSWGLWKLSYSTQFLWGIFSVVITTLGVYSAVSPPSVHIILHKELQIRYVLLLNEASILSQQFNFDKLKFEKALEEYEKILTVESELKAKEPEAKMSLLRKAQNEVKQEVGIA